jgi:hypothetical protein
MPEHDTTHSQAILFSGHMIDAPGRNPPRFPPALEPAVSEAIRDAVKRIDPGATGVGICSAACGGDILFAETLIDRGVPIRVYLPFDERTFMDKSVNFADDRWADRYHAVVSRSKLFLAPDVLGELPQGADPFERTNLWMLDEARRLGGERVSFICLWNGEGGDGPGGTEHMMDAVRASGGDVDWIDIRKCV